jgi:hypothetical protein
MNELVKKAALYSSIAGLPRAIWGYVAAIIAITSVIKV